MKNIIKLAKIFFLLKPRFISTIFFIPILYSIGWALSQPLLLLNFEKENLSLIGTIFTFLLFIFFLPYWFYIKRNISSTWSLLGITKHKLLKLKRIKYLEKNWQSFLRICLLLSQEVSKHLICFVWYKTNMEVKG